MSSKNQIRKFMPIIILLLLQVSCGSPVKSPSGSPVTPIATSGIPTSGEWADSDTLNIASFILDYTTVNGTIVATLTQVFYDCHTGTGGAGHSAQSSATMNIDQNGHVTLQSHTDKSQNEVVYGDINFVGKYDGTNFILTTSDIVVSNAPGPLTLIFKPVSSALTPILAKYQATPCK